MSVFPEKKNLALPPQNLLPPPRKWFRGGKNLGGGQKSREGQCPLCPPPKPPLTPSFTIPSWECFLMQISHVLTWVGTSTCSSNPILSYSTIQFNLILSNYPIQSYHIQTTNSILYHEIPLPGTNFFLFDALYTIRIVHVRHSTFKSNPVVGVIPRWAQFRGGRNPVVGAIPWWVQFRDGRNSVVGAIPW